MEPKRKILVTAHAMLCIHERFKGTHTLKEILSDIRNNFTSIRLLPNGKYSVKSNREMIYILERKEDAFIVITIYDA